MNQELKFNIINNVVGSEKVDKFLSGIDSIGDRVVKAAGSLYILNNARQALDYGFSQAKSIIEYGDSLEKLSEKVGIGSQALSGYRAAAELADIGFDGLEKSLKKFSQHLGDHNAKDFNNVLKALGITSRDSSVIIDQLADKFSKMENGPKKAAIAVALFGKSGIDMIPFLNQGSEALSKFGVKFSSDFTKNSAEFNDTLTLSKNLILEQSIALAEKYIPVLTDVAKAWNDVQISNRKATKLDDSLTSVKEFALSTYTVFKFLSEGLDGIFTNIKNEWIFLKNLNAEAANILTFGASSGNFGSISKHFGKDWEAGNKELKESISEYQKRSEERKFDVFKFEQALEKTTLDRKNNKTNKSNKNTRGDDNYNLQSNDSDAVKRFQKEQQGQIELEKNKLESYRLSSTELAKLNIEQQIRNQSDKEAIKLNNDGKVALSKVTDEIIRQRIELIEREEAQKRSYAVGASRAFNSYLENVRDVSKQTEQMFSRAFGNIEDSLVNFVKEGKRNFEDFTNAVIDDLIRISIRQATLGLYQGIGSFFAGGAAASVGAGAASTAGLTLGSGITVAPFANGGVMTSKGSIPLNYYANGGIANRPQLAVFGEGRVPEAYVPLPDGRSIPVSMKGGGGNAISISVQVDASGNSQVSGDKEGVSLGEGIADAVKGVLIKELRPGGILSRK